MKKNNKGFSLVELIVVVLIMGILAVALTPQVLKWVDNSRISNDKSLMQSIVSNTQAALTNAKAYAEISDDTHVTTKTTITVNYNDGLKIRRDKDTADLTSSSEFFKKLAEYSGYKGDESKLSNIKTSHKSGVITIEITKGGAVSGKYTGPSNLADYESETAQ